MSVGGALRQIFAEFGISWDGAALDRGNRQVEGAIEGLQNLAAAFAGSAILGAIRSFADGMAEESSALQDAADQMGATAGELQELEHAGVMAGLSSERAAGALLHLQQASAAAATGAQGPASAFRALGVHLKDADGNVRSTADLMDDLAVNFGTIEDPARRAQLAQDLFGRSGARMLNVLHEGAGGLAELRAEVELLGGGLLPEAIEASNAYDDAMDRQKVATRALRSVLAIELMPRLTELATRGTELVVWLVRMTRDTNFARTAMYVLGVVGAAAGARFLAGWLPTLVRFGGMALIIAGVAAVLEDLISLAHGGPSAIGDFVDATYGMGTSIRLAQTLNEGWRGMIDYIKELGARAGYVFSEKVPASASKLVAPFVAAFHDIEGAWNDLWSHVGGPVMQVAHTMERVAHALTLGDLHEDISRSIVHRIAGDAANAGGGTVEARGAEVAGIFGRIARDVRDEYADIFNGQNGALARAAPPQVSPRVGHGVTNNTRTINVGQVVVQGAGDSRRVADDVVRRLHSEAAATHDAALPTNAHGSE